MAKIYAVKKGKKPGIYHTWEECQEQVNGFSNAEYKSFKKQEEAEEYLQQNSKQTGKIYAVRAGKVPGIYDTWEECQEQVSGFSNAEYKAFKNKEEAEEYLQNGDVFFPGLPDDGKTAYAYIDGSYNAETGFYGAGIVLLYNGEEHRFKYSGDDSGMARMRNVAGEILASSLVFSRIAKGFGFKRVVIYHDYTGIAFWCTEQWKSKNEYTAKYKRMYQKAVCSGLKIAFKKVKSHSEDRYNDIADQLAKEACGIS